MAAADKNLALDASEVLAAALGQMDDIIAAATPELQNGDLSMHSTSKHSINHSSSCPLKSSYSMSSTTGQITLKQLLEELSFIIVTAENDGNDNHSTKENDINPKTVDIIYRWLMKFKKNDVGNAPVLSDDANSFKKIQQLESEKKNLLLQVSVLQEQVDAQTEKVKELESIIEEKHRQSREIEKNLHQEMVTRSAVENTKLELLTEISSLRQKLTIAERERRESEERCRRIEGDLGSLYDRVGNTDAEQSVFRNRAGGNGMIPSSSNKGHEIEKLRRTLESVMLSNEEKDQRIEDLRLTLIKYKALHDAVYSSHQKKGSDATKELPLTEIECLRDLKSSPSPRNEAIPQCQSLGKLGNKPPAGLPLICSTQSHSETRYLNEKNVPPIQNCSHQSSCSVCPSVTVNKSNSLENVHQASLKASSSAKSAYGTMPRQNGPQALQELHEQLQHYENRPTEIDSCCVDSLPVPDKKPHEETNRGSRNKSSGVSFGKGFFKLRTGKRSSSAPELAPLESVTIPRVDREYISASPTPQPTMQPFIIKPERDRSKGFRKFFTKWKRSGSQNIEKLEGDFRRGNIRATAGPRLGWSRDVSADPDIPFPRWTTDYVVEWLHKIGLSMYISECKRWRCNGEVLLNATPQEIEKQLNLKNSMHKKKLLLAVQAMKSDNLPSSVNQMDYLWVLRWLDDVGLPQYKDAFTEARVDGRLLHYLTVEDLLHLKVTNQLHHVSIKRGIQVLREQHFNPHCLIRRSSPDEDKVYTPERVALWTNHRVMEWLRTVDLSEYAPNLRGSGVHGALIVYEPKFNTDLFATVLNIPPTKTLLRRHLATHFKTIIGADLAQVKRDLETDQLYTPLTPSFKIKGIRKPQFSLKKKKGKPDGEDEEFVCPMDIPVGSEPMKPDGEKLVVRRNSDPVPQEKALDIEDEKAVEEIGAVSKEITSLTSMLQEEKLLKSAPTTNV